MPPSWWGCQSSRLSESPRVSGWWGAGRFLDGMSLGMGSLPLFSYKGNNRSMGDGEPRPLSFLQAAMVRGQRVPTMISFHVARGGGERGMSERSSRTCQT